MFYGNKKMRCSCRNLLRRNSDLKKSIVQALPVYHGIMTSIYSKYCFWLFSGAIIPWPLDMMQLFCNQDWYSRMTLTRLKDGYAFPLALN